jgi:carboxyl-terminal processing protease
VLLGALLVQLPLALADRGTGYEWFDPIILVRRYLLDGYVEEPDEEAMQHLMIQGMIDALDDPYTVYIPPAEEAEFNKDLRGTYVGIGAEVIIQNGLLTIVTPLEDSPALASGVRAGDIVLEIDGTDTPGKSVQECIDLLVGEEGTDVAIEVRHLDGTEETLSIERRRIITPTVKGVRRDGEAWDYWLDPSRRIGYVRLTQFNNTSADDLRRTVEPLVADGLRGLIFDLRDNPGGELSIAIEISDLFLESGLIVSVTGRGRRDQSWHARREETLPEFPMVILVNGFSASAAEIVAGALQENDRAKVLGTRTFGKGTVQEVHELPHERGVLKLTSGYYALSSGRNIARRSDSTIWGVDPDPGFAVSVKDRDYAHMILERRRFEVIRSADDGPEQSFADSAWIRETLGDEQLAAAVDAMHGRLDAGDWPRVGEADSTHLALGERVRSELRLRRQLLNELERTETRIRELRGLESEVGREPLLPEEIDLEGGSLVVRDAGGAPVATFRIEEGDLEGALRLAPLEPLDAADS